MNTLVVKSSIDELPGVVEGISFIYTLMNNSECVYVGQSTNLKQRIYQHLADGKEFKNIEFFECSNYAANTKEAEQIVKKRPTLNKSLPNCDKYCGCGYIKDVAGIYCEVVKEKLDSVFEGENRSGIVSRYFLRNEVDKFVHDIDIIVSEYSRKWNSARNDDSETHV